MVLCELTSTNANTYWEFFQNLFAAWAILAGLGFLSMVLISATIFSKYYMHPTYEQWRWKSNPKYPTPEKVRDEIFQMAKGTVTGTLCPALALTISKGQAWFQSKAFCNSEYGYSYDVISFFAIWFGCDFFEWGYHYLGHKFRTMWQFHKAHHVFFNPTPFAVIADEYVDMFIRSSPLFLIPMFFPVNMDILWFTFAVFFYGYGTFIHWGYESQYLSAHNPIINTPFQHYCHHAVSGPSTPYHTGFFFKIWDQMAGSVYPRCFCVRCQQAQGKRDRVLWEKVVKQDYSVLLEPSFYFNKAALKFDQTKNEEMELRGRLDRK